MLSDSQSRPQHRQSHTDFEVAPSDQDRHDMPVAPHAPARSMPLPAGRQQAEQPFMTHARTGKRSRRLRPSRAPIARGSNPGARVSAAFAYVIPLVPAMVLLYRERDDRFVRLHASRSLIFSALVAIGQTVLFAALVSVGGAIGDGLPVAAIAGLVFYVAFIAFGVLSLTLWFLMLRDAMSDTFSSLPIVTRLAIWLEKRLTSLRLIVSASRVPVRNR